MLSEATLATRRDWAGSELHMRRGWASASGERNGAVTIPGPRGPPRHADKCRPAGDHEMGAGCVTHAAQAVAGAVHLTRLPVPRHVTRRSPPPLGVGALNQPGFVSR